MAKRLKRSGLRLENGLQTSLQLESLPDELLLKVFSYFEIQELLRCSHVSKRIRRVCNDKSLWKVVDLCDTKLKVKAEFIKAILENDCEYLDLRNCEIDGSIKLSKSSKLMYLDLGCYASKRFLHEILLSCCSLRALMLDCQYKSNTVFQKFCSQNCQTLQALNLQATNWLSTKSVQVIVTKCTELKEISLECFEPGLDQNTLTQLVSGLSPDIKELSLGGNDEVTDEHIETLVSSCNKITALDVGGMSFLTNNAITSILNHLKLSLRELDITDCPNIELAKVLELESLPKLKVLNFGLFPWDEMPGLMKKLPHLIINKKFDDRFINVGSRIA